MAFSLGEYQDVFLEEADELLQELNQDLLQMEKNPDDIDMINNIFRAAHTFKSSAAAVGLTELSKLAHEMENLLQGIRDGSMKASHEIVDIIFKCFDEISGVIDSISKGEEPNRDLTSLITEIRKISGESSEDENTEEKAKGNASYNVPVTKLSVDDLKNIKTLSDNGLKCFELAVYVDPNAQMKFLKMQLILAHMEKAGQVIKSFPESDQLESGNVFKVILMTSYEKDNLASLCNIDQIVKVVFRILSFEKREDGKFAAKFNADGETVLSTESTAESVPQKASLNKQSKAADNTDSKKHVTLKSIKVSIDKLDQLLNNVGELVVVNSGFYKLYEDLVKNLADKSFLADFKNRMDQMSLVEKELQSGIMKTRMVPISEVFDRFGRLVRDLAKTDNKNIQLVITGEETEIDKKVVDSIGEPLIHLLRNAVDHGIESAEERQAAGKPEVGVVTLNAYQSGSQIFVEVGDDGKGLDVDQIRTKAVEKNFVEPEAAENMSNEEILSLIFLPGFSTANKVTDISGRGVGMNVVKETVNELNGNVKIQTEKNVGTKFILEFPLTLAIIPAIMVTVGTEQYAIPLSEVEETVNIQYSDITTVEGKEVINLRGDVVPLLRLSRLVGTKCLLAKEDRIPIVIVSYTDKTIGLMVDALGGKLEIVIKSLEQNYKAVPGLSGASVLGDGSVCLILDVSTMISMAIADQDGYYTNRWIFDGELSDRVKDLQEPEAETEKSDAEVEEGLSEEESESEVKSESSDEDDPDGINVKTVEARADKDWRKIFGDEAEDEEKAEETEKTEEEDDTFGLPEETVSKEANEDNEDTEEAEQLSYEASHVEPLPEQAAEPESSAKPVSDNQEPEPPAKTASANESDDIEVIIDDDIPSTDGKTALGAENFSSENEIVITGDKPSQASADGGSKKNEYKLQPAVKAKAEQEVVDQTLVDEVKVALDEFRKELKRNVKDTVDDGFSEVNIIGKSINLSAESIRRLQGLANVGAANAAQSISKLFSRQIDLSIPEVDICLVSEVAEKTGCADENYIGVELPIKPETIGSVLFLLNKQEITELVNALYASHPEITENDSDIEKYKASILKEMTNIVGSSVLNVISEKIGMTIQPDVPSAVFCDVTQILSENNLQKNSIDGYAIVMDTAFYIDSDKLIGHLVLLPGEEMAKILVSRLSA